MNATATLPRHDDECRTEARNFLARLTGCDVTRIAWDTTHRLQGHATVAGRELVVIAARDAAHAPVVMTEAEWDEFRHTPRTAA